MAEVTEHACMRNIGQEVEVGLTSLGSLPVGGVWAQPLRTVLAGHHAGLASAPPASCSPISNWIVGRHRILAIICEVKWKFSRSVRVGCHSLLQGIFLTQGLNSGLLHCRKILYFLSHQETGTYWWKIWWGKEFTFNDSEQFLFVSVCIWDLHLPVLLLPKLSKMHWQTWNTLWLKCTWDKTPVGALLFCLWSIYLALLGRCI